MYIYIYTHKHYTHGPHRGGNLGGGALPSRAQSLERVSAGITRALQAPVQYAPTGMACRGFRWGWAVLHGMPNPTQNSMLDAIMAVFVW